MNTKQLFSLGAVLALSLSVVPVQAQGNVLLKSQEAPFNEYFSTQRGVGSVQRKGDSVLNLEFVTVELKRGGNAAIKFKGRSNYELYGKWRALDINSFTFTYTSGGRSGASLRSSNTEGQGRIELRDGKVYTVSADGKFGGDDFKASFSASNSSGGGSGSGTQLVFEDTANGNGFLNAEGKSDRTISQVDVKLYSNNAARITLKVKTGGEHKLRGIWKRGLAGVTILSDLEGDNISLASGTLIRRSERVTNLSLKGKIKGERFTLNFRPR